MAIRTATDKILAIVEYIGQQKEGKFGPAISILMKRHDLEGDAAKVWKTFKPSDAAKFQKGQQVALYPIFRDGRQTWDIEILDGPTAPTSPRPAAESPGKYNAPTQPTQLDKAQKLAVAAYIAERADLMSFCFQTATGKFPNLDAQQQAAAALELYRSAISKFNL